MYWPMVYFECMISVSFSVELQKYWITLENFLMIFYW
jgi:hypothetical protein